METVIVKNCGPIEEISINLPVGEGGVVVLEGANGSGKSIVIDAVDRLLGDKKQKPPIRDNAGVGLVEGLGVTLVVSERTSATGDLAVESISGKFAMAKLVEPGLTDIAAADAARIKAVLALAPKPADPEAGWASVVEQAGVEFADLGVDVSDDPVVMAGRIKRELESLARKEESEFERLKALYAAKIADAVEFGPEVSRDTGATQTALLETTRAVDKLQAEILNYAAVEKSIIESNAALAAMEPSKIDELEMSLTAAHSHVSSLDAEKHKLQMSLARVLIDIEAGKKDIDSKTALVDSERKRSTAREALQAIANKPIGKPVSAAKLQKALRDAQAAQKAHEQSILAKEADRRAEEAQAIRAERDARMTDGSRIRAAAKSVDTVLSGMIDGLGVGFVIDVGRLCVETHRGTEPFAELSHGERWRYAIQLGQRATGDRGVLAIPQEAWEGLDPEAKQEIADLCREFKVVILTAQAASGGITQRLL